MKLVTGRQHVLVGQAAIFCETIIYNIILAIISSKLPTMHCVCTTACITQNIMHGGNLTLINLPTKYNNAK